MLATPRPTYTSMHDILNLAKKYSPKLVKGYSSGNISVVDKKSWLEVCDHKHRYGANLRAYYKEWKRLSSAHLTSPNFWEWLEDEAVEIEGIPRTKLEREIVLYCDTAAERKQFALSIIDGVVYQDATQERVHTRDEGWIFVLRDGVLYGGQKVTTQTPRIHHTSFVGGECVQTAGMMVIVNGRIRLLYPHSGHYRPSEHEVLILLRFLNESKVDLRRLKVDMQRIQKVYRRQDLSGEFVKKVDNAYFWNTLHALWFLEAKEAAWKAHLFVELKDSVNRNNVSVIPQLEN